MSRKAPVISLSDLQQKLSKLLYGGEFPYELPKKLEQDLEKIQFDFENCEIGNADPGYEQYPSSHEGFSDYPCGWFVLPSGIPVLFVNAGGDWEFPICFVIYWDGKNIRGYIPEEGNSFDYAKRRAWGNEMEDDDFEMPDESPEEKWAAMVDKDKIIQDVTDRIAII